MPGVHEELRAAGIRFEADGAQPALRSECARLASRVRERQLRSIGLAPAGDDVAVPAVAIELGSALAERSAGPVGVVDASGSWACARALVERALPDGTPLATSWLLGNLAVLAPRTRHAGAVLGHLRGFFLGQAATFDHLVVDLTGLDHLGEHLAAIGLLDAVVLVARSGITTARQVQRRIRGLPEGRSLGVLLTGL